LENSERSFQLEMAQAILENPTFCMLTHTTRTQIRARCPTEH
jgi:hypothetical protein